MYIELYIYIYVCVFIFVGCSELWSPYDQMQKCKNGKVVLLSFELLRHRSVRKALPTRDVRV